MTILILSFEGDPHADAVESALENKGAKFYRYGFNSFPARSTLSVSLSADQDPHFLLKNQGIELALKDVTSVWCRRSGQAVAPENTDKNMGQYIRGEAKYILDAIEYFMPHAFWVSSRRSTAAAENKLVQLKIASEAGFLLPESCIGNDPQAVSQLINSQKQLCIKPVKQPNLHRDATFFEKIKGFLYNRKYRNLLAGLKYNPKLLAEFEYMTIRCMMTALLTDKQAREALLQVSHCPVIFQEYIPKKFELRITVIGKRVFACAIYSQEASKAAGKVDWRSAIDELRHEAYELPIEIQAKCVNLIKKLDLQMGCIDMIVTPDDQYVFLEVNPQGQWLWIEEKTSLPIAEAIADLLVTRDGIK